MVNVASLSPTLGQYCHNPTNQSVVAHGALGVVGMGMDSMASFSPTPDQSCHNLDNQSGLAIVNLNSGSGEAEGDKGLSFERQCVEVGLSNFTLGGGDIVMRNVVVD
ncbi:SAM-dependent methyltransferase [Sesbania bispinosa]|nr:SAM-dependent methyltransferase [Sesbania bispinosa]